MLHRILQVEVKAASSQGSVLPPLHRSFFDNNHIFVLQCKGTIKADKRVGHLP